MILEENELWDIFHNTTANPIVVPTDEVDKDAFMKRDVKARRVILVGLKDHVIPSISTRDHAF